MAPPRVDPVKRFWPKVDRSGEHWLWTAALHRFGYGKFNYRLSDGRPVTSSAARFALELALGRPLEAGMSALHVCDVPACVRNDEEGWYEVNGVVRPRRGHLFEGAPGDNAADRESKGRSVYSYGERHGNAKLTEDQVRDIKRLLLAGRSIQSIADEFGVTYTPIQAIRAGRTWRQVQIPPTE